VAENLGEIIDLGLAIHNADGRGFSREEILMVASMLDAFANLRTDWGLCSLATPY